MGSVGTLRPRLRRTTGGVLVRLRHGLQGVPPGTLERRRDATGLVADAADLVVPFREFRGPLHHLPVGCVPPAAIFGGGVGGGFTRGECCEPDGPQGARRVLVEVMGNPARIDTGPGEGLESSPRFRAFGRGGGEGLDDATDARGEISPGVPEPKSLLGDAGDLVRAKQANGNRRDLDRSGAVVGGGDDGMPPHRVAPGDFLATEIEPTVDPPPAVPRSRGDRATDTRGGRVACLLGGPDAAIEGIGKREVLDRPVPVRNNPKRAVRAHLVLSDDDAAALDDAAPEVHHRLAVRADVVGDAGGGGDYAPVQPGPDELITDGGPGAADSGDVVPPLKRVRVAGILPGGVVRGGGFGVGDDSDGVLVLVLVHGVSVSMG